MRIYYIKEGDNGAIYHFYDKDGNEIKEHKIKALKAMVRYEIEGTPKWDKFYAFANHSDSHHIIIRPYLAWGNPVFHQTKPDIGTGKKNTKKMLSVEFLEEKPTIFSWIQTFNDMYYENYDDWYIPSEYELEELLHSSIEREYIRSTLDQHGIIWSSTETFIGDTNAICCNWAMNHIDIEQKYRQKKSVGAIAIRSF